MRVATEEEQDRLFGFTPDLFQRLEQLKSTGASVEDLLAHLRQSGVPQPAASLALRRINAVSELVEARQAVEGSSAYATWPEPDAAFPEVFRVYVQTGRPTADLTRSATHP